MEAFLTSTFLVAIAEIGDKTQLLSFVLAARLRKPWPIIAGIFVATIANHAGAAWVGSLLTNVMDPRTLQWIVGLCFIGFGLWALHPDSLDDGPRIHKAGAFVTGLSCLMAGFAADFPVFLTLAFVAEAFFSVWAFFTTGFAAGRSAILVFAFAAFFSVWAFFTTGFAAGCKGASAGRTYLGVIPGEPCGSKARSRGE